MNFLNHIQRVQQFYGGTLSLHFYTFLQLYITTSAVFNCNIIVFMVLYEHLARSFRAWCEYIPGHLARWLFNIFKDVINILLSIVTRHADDAGLPLSINMVGTNYIQGAYISSGHPEHQWYLCTRGEGELIINGHTYVINKNIGFLVLAHTAYELKNTTEDWNMDILGFSGSLSAEILEAIGFSSSEAYHFFDDDSFHRHIGKIIRAAKKSPLPENEDFSKMCYDFLIDLPKCISHIQRSEGIESAIDHNHAVHKVISYLENHFSESFSLDDLASEIGLTKGYLCRLFKETMGITIITELTHIRIGRARIFLTQYPEKSVSEIACMSGFENAGYFGKVFKRLNGQTPDQYRRKKASPQAAAEISHIAYAPLLRSSDDSASGTPR